MPSTLSRRLILVAVCALCLLAAVLPAAATCGGGGGGGMGGANPGGGEAQVYHVPWKVIAPGAASPDTDLVLYWFPISVDDARGSELLTSRYLTESAGQCVGMALIPSSNGTVRGKYAVGTEKSVVLLASKDGTEIGRVNTDGGKVRATDVEDVVRKEIDRREEAAKKSLDDAKEKLEQKDADGATTLYSQVWDQRCLLPGPAKKAAKALKKLGKPVAESESSRLEKLDDARPNFSEPRNGEIIRTMEAGLTAERAGKYAEAERMYSAARRMDPADPVPLRFLGELYRHQTGEWVKARAVFTQVLAMRADPISRAVALHGLGKMTIHDGEFAKGVSLFERSIEAFPLALTYRNLAVYWNSEKNFKKAYEYVEKAMALEPDDEYNQIFAATYLVELGKPEEAAKVAQQHEKVLEASYNLAAIHAQLGNKAKALDLLRRHFYAYEQFEAVRAKEMQEARDDIAFAAFHKDPDFIKLTELADLDDSTYHRKKL